MATATQMELRKLRREVKIYKIAASAVRAYVAAKAWPTRPAHPDSRQVQQTYEALLLALQAVDEMEGR